MARVGIALLIGLVVLAGVVIVRALDGPPNLPAEEPPLSIALDAEAAAERFAGGLRIRTISNGRDTGIPLDEAAFVAFHDYLDVSYPRVHASLGRERVSGYSLLYTWTGSDPDLDPLLLLGHMDVVPVEPGTEPQWPEPPYAGNIRDGIVWGRGAIDNKANVFGLMEATELLLARGFEPRRTVILAFGHDEELGGGDGAVAMAALLASRGVHPVLVVDEGGGVAEGLFPGIDTAVAAIGVAEKGAVNLELVVQSDGGHSSVPPAETAVGVLAKAIVRLQTSPFAAGLDGPMREMFETVGPSMNFGYRAVAANLWLFSPLVERALLASPRTAAMIRTTAAPTIFQAGVKSNILPTVARAVVNFRIHPRDRIESVVEHVRRAIDDPRVAVEVGGGREPSSVSPTDSEGYRLLARTIRQTQPDAVVTPFLIFAGTDARHYRRLTSNVYGFQPVRLGPETLQLAHGIGEHLSVENLVGATRFFAQLIWNASL